MDFEPTMLASVSHLKRDDLEFNIEEIVQRMRLVHEVQDRMKGGFHGDPLGFRPDVEVRVLRPPAAPP
jgi:hypothetical protein